MSRKTKLVYNIITVILWLVVWQVTAIRINNRIFLPSPAETLHSLTGLMLSAAFYQSIGISLGNIAGGFLLGVFAGIGLAVVASFSAFTETFLNFPIRVIKATPVASFTILALFWIDSTKLSVLISFFMVLPVIYTNVLAGIRATDGELAEMASVFRLRLFDRFRFLYVPAVLPHFFSAVSVAIGLAWKSGIAAEVIGLSRNSIGNHLYQAKIYMEMPELFAWTMVTIVISIGSEKLLLLLIKLAEKTVAGPAEETVEYVAMEERETVKTEENFLAETATDNRFVWVEGVSKSFGEKKLFDSISMTLTPEKPMALMGNSGIGKTTLLRIVLGRETPDTGRVIRGAGVTGVAVVFQENRLFEHISVERNLYAVCRSKAQAEAVEPLLKRLGLYDCRKQRTSCLSGGMKRRLAIGRALLFEAEVLLLDEPFQGLDAETKSAVIQLVKQKMQGKSVLLITHDETEGVHLGCQILRI